MSLFSIPLLIFPKYTILFFLELPSQEILSLSRLTCVWLWLLVFANGFNFIGFSLITASRDTVFHLIVTSFNYFTIYIPVKIGMNILGWGSDKYWLVVAIDAFIMGMVFLARAKKERWKKNKLSLIA